MSNYKNCAIYVDGNGNYCCATKELCVEKGRAYTVHVVGGPFPYFSAPTGDPTDGLVEAGVLEDGVNLIYQAGEYIIEHPDCEALDGTPAPEEGAAMICCYSMEITEGFMQFEKLCEILGVLEATAEAEGMDFQAMIDKLCKLLEANGPIEAKLCEILDAEVESGELTCKKLEAIFDVLDGDLCDKLNQIIANTSAIVGIETSLGQIGCTEDAEGNITGHVLVCKQNTPDGEPDLVVHWFGLNGEHVEGYEGEYVGCTSLKRLEQLLESILECQREIKKIVTWTCMEGYDKVTCKPVFWMKGVDQDGNIVYPNGSKCPIYYSGVFSKLPQCDCLNICASRNITGIGGVTLTAQIETSTAANGDHVIKFDPTLGTNASIETQLNNANNSLVCVLFVGGAAFAYSPSTLTGSNGSYTSSRPVPTNSCEQELIDQEWNNQIDAVSAPTNGYGMRHCTPRATNCLVVDDCTAPMDPQPEEVCIGPPPDKAMLALLEAIAAKPDPFQIKDLFTCTEGTGTLRNREWIVGERPPRLLDEAAGRAVFDTFDTTQEPVIDEDWATLDANDTDSSATLQDYQLIDGFLKVETPCWLRWATGSAGYINVQIGFHCGTPETVVEGARGDGTFNPTNSVYVPRGIHSIAIHNIDDWVNTSPAAFYSKDGVEFSATNVPPGFKISRTKFIETQKCVKFTCNPNTSSDLITGEPVDLANCYLTPLVTQATAEAASAAASMAAILGKMCEPCRLTLMDVVVNEDGTISGTAEGDASCVNGTTQTVYDKFGNEIGTGVIETKFDEESNTSAVSVKPATPIRNVATIGTVISVGTVLTPLSPREVP